MPYNNLTCFVGCKLHITRRPPYFFVYKGRLPLGIICKVVPKHMLRSATLKECELLNITCDIDK